MLADKDLLSIQEVRTKVEQAWQAQRKYCLYTQTQVDAIVEHVAAAARSSARALAELAVEETGYGNAQDKYVKNLLASDWLPRKMRGMKTIGVLRELPEERLVEIGVPLGVVAAVLPTTNPTSTAIYKILIALKSGNAIVLSPHPRAFKCTCAATSLMARAAIEAGAPAGVIQCIDHATIEGTNALMRHERTSVILATGGAGMVKAAYSSGKPAYGVGPGNVPVLVDTSADLPDAIAKIVAGKSFDYGTVCSSEQAVVAELPLRERILALLKENRAHIATEAQREALGKLLVRPNWTINPDCVGQAPTKLARMAGFEVAPNTSIICCETGGVGKQFPLSMEKLSPVLSLHFVADYAAALDTCYALLKFGGMGHTAVIHSKNDARIREYGLRMPANRVLVNTPSPQGSTGITTNVFPAMTLGCGAAAGNITSDNVGPQHLMNIKRIAYVVRTPEQAFEMPLDIAKAPASAAAPVIDRDLIVRAVEKYLASRGVVIERTLAPVAPPAPSAPACGCQHKPAALPAVAADVVDRFLAARAVTPPPVEPARPAPPPAPPVPAAPPPPPQAVDFVCEADVREAIKENRKLYIGPKTIVTPSARDLAVPSDILVMV